MLQKLAAYFFGRRFSFAFSVIASITAMAAMAGQFWVVCGLIFIGIPCVGIAEVSHARKVIAANNKTIAENAETIEAQLKALREMRGF